MAVSIVSSIIFFLLFIILSQFVDGNVFAAQMEHRKLGGAKKTMTMRRNLEENGRQGSKIATHGSTSRQGGQKNIQKEPTNTRPDKATAQGKYLTYEALRKREAVCNSNRYSDCLGAEKTNPPDQVIMVQRIPQISIPRRLLESPCKIYNRCKRGPPLPSSSEGKHGLGH